jgi:hypothetical protein
MTTLDEIRKTIDDIDNIYKEWLYDTRRNEKKNLFINWRIFRRF